MSDAVDDPRRRSPSMVNSRFSTSWYVLVKCQRHDRLAFTRGLVVSAVRRTYRRIGGGPGRAYASLRPAPTSVTTPGIVAAWPSPLRVIDPARPAVHHAPPAENCNSRLGLDSARRWTAGTSCAGCSALAAWSPPGRPVTASTRPPRG